MKYLPLVWAGLWRKRTRTLFTLLSIMIAFLLFGMLQGTNAAFTHGVEGANVNRLVTVSRISFTEALPYADLAQIEAAPMGPNRVSVFTAHQMGGCRMGADPSRSVVDPQLRHHAMDNLFVVDGSVFPTSLGVNPMESIYGIASWASDHVRAAVA